MRKQLIPFLLLILFCFTQQSFASNEENFTLQQGKNISLVVEKNEEKVVHLAIDLLKRDMKSVLDAELTIGGKESHVIIGLSPRAFGHEWLMPLVNHYCD